MTEGKGVTQRGRHVLRALLWKEWRQQRWILLTIMVASMVIFFAAIPVSHDFAYLITALVWMSAPVVMGANAFVGEEDDGSAEFIRLVPVRSATVFWLKAVTLLAFLFAGAMLVATVGYFVLAKVAGKSYRYPGMFVIAYFIVPLALASLVPAIVSVFARRTISCVIASVITVFLIARLVIFFWQGSLARHGWFGSAGGVLLLGLSGFVLLAVGGRWLWCWSRVTRKLRSRIFRVACLAVALCVLTVGGVVVNYVYVTFFAPLDSFLQGGRHGQYGRLDSASPDGRYMAVTVSYRYWQGECGERAAVIDTESGYYQWLSRWHTSYWPQQWSPSSAKALFLLTNCPLWPPIFSNIDWYDNPDLVSDQRILYPKTGEHQSISDIFPELADGLRENKIGVAGWWDDDTIILFNRDAFLFADTTDGSVRRCRLSADIAAHAAGKADHWWLRPHAKTKRGVFSLLRHPQGDSEDKTTLTILRFAPDFEECRTVTVSVKGKEAFLWYRGPRDGRWGVISARMGHGQNLSRHYVTQLETGETILLTAPETENETGLAGPNCVVAGFRADKNVLVLHDEHDIIQYDIDARSVMRMPAGEGLSGNWPVSGVRMSGSGRYLLLGEGWCGWRLEGGTHGPLQMPVMDLDTGKSWLIPCMAEARWLGDERLLLIHKEYRHGDHGLWIINRDGTGERRLLLKER